MDGLTLLGLIANIPRVNAIREIQARQCRGPLTADRVYDLILAATGDESQAQEQGTAFRFAELMTGQKPA